MVYGGDGSVVAVVVVDVRRCCCQRRRRRRRRSCRHLRRCRRLTLSLLHGRRRCIGALRVSEGTTRNITTSKVCACSVGDSIQTGKLSFSLYFSASPMLAALSLNKFTAT